MWQCVTTPRVSPGTSGTLQGEGLGQQRQRILSRACASGATGGTLPGARRCRLAWHGFGVAAATPEPLRKQRWARCGLCADFTLGAEGWRCQHCQLLPRQGWRGHLGVHSVLCCPTKGREALGTFSFICDCREKSGMGHVREVSAKGEILELLMVSDAAVLHKEGTVQILLLQAQGRSC